MSRTVQLGKQGFLFARGCKPFPRGNTPVTSGPHSFLQCMTLHGGVLGIHHNSYEIGESSSSRNVRMRMTIEEPQLSSSLYPTGQVSRNPSPPWAGRNTTYDPSYDTRGLPVDPHLRCLTYMNCNQPWAIRNTLYDPSYALRGLASDPHLRCLSLENAANHGNGDRLGSN
ncbi:hypothetical protein D0Y65_025222 [Glycine soja]|uniref:Uncharacterized protein n=1 Tax=Glycine soja TaxID=3848 RepID=A0A445J5X4_GLYSO|nr:hypothetical protein glysoja_005005 [Glycine soja]RZB93782.1 hypothetical protein D0Y65_025222 [Glycine soja]